VFTGDTVRVWGKIDNSLGTTIIESCKLKLNEYLFMCAGHSTDLKLGSYDFMRINKAIQSGAVY
jgi:hypothetical protein